MGTSTSLISTHQIVEAVPSLLSYHFKKMLKKNLHRRKQQYISHTANKNRKKTNADHLETEIKYFVFI